VGLKEDTECRVPTYKVDFLLAVHRSAVNLVVNGHGRSLDSNNVYLDYVGKEGDSTEPMRI